MAAPNPPRNIVENYPAAWDPEEDPIVEMELPGKYKSTVSNILSKHCTEVRLLSEETIQTATHISKKKLKDLIVKHNNEIFSFMSNPERSPQILGTAETIFRRYGHDVPNIRCGVKSNMLKDLNLDVSLERAMEELQEGLKRNKGEGGLEDFMRQMRWMINQYKNMGEEVVRLETTLFQKMELLDKVNHRLPLITNLASNDSLPPLMDAFSKYAEEAYQSSHFEENYKELIDSYKKWNVCRQILSFPNMIRSDGSEPTCSICLLESVSFAIVPCGHTFCGTCARKQNTTCYICRGPIRERMKLFFT